MPLDHNNATASIHVTGLALGCFNKGERRWEVAFLKQPGHNLLMIVIKRTKFGDELLCSVCNFDPNVWIYIEAQNAIEVPPEETLFTPDGDPENFKLILDIEKEVYEGRPIAFRDSWDKRVIPLLISHPKLYAVGKLSKYPMKLIDLSNTSKQKKLRKIKSTVGADIQCREGGRLNVRVKGPGGFALPLPKEEGTKYNIFFDNICPNDLLDPYLEADLIKRREKSVRKTPTSTYTPEHSDFVLYYDVIDDKGMGKFDLQEDSDPGPGAVCNKSYLGLKNGMFS